MFVEGVETQNLASLQLTSGLDFLSIQAYRLWMEHPSRGKVNFGGVIKQVNLSYVPEAKAGDYVIVHVGFALSVVDEKQAKQVFEYLKTIGELSEIEGESNVEAV
jgi:hydrogenase expression/formation protein HypC